MKHCNVLMLELNMSQTDSCMKAQRMLSKVTLLAQRNRRCNANLLESRN